MSCFHSQQMAWEECLALKPLNTSHDEVFTVYTEEIMTKSDLFSPAVTRKHHKVSDVCFSF